MEGVEGVEGVKVMEGVEVVDGVEGVEVQQARAPAPSDGQIPQTDGPGDPTPQIVAGNQPQQGVDEERGEIEMEVDEWHYLDVTGTEQGQLP